MLVLTCDPRSAVVEALKLGRAGYYVARGEDVDAGSNVLAIITTKILLIIHGRHFSSLPRCRFAGVLLQLSSFLLG